MYDIPQLKVVNGARSLVSHIVGGRTSGVTAGSAYCPNFEVAKCARPIARTCKRPQILFQLDTDAAYELGICDLTRP